MLTEPRGLWREVTGREAALEQETSTQRMSQLLREGMHGEVRSVQGQEQF